MSVRCHNDPLDIASDVCDSCGDQFCESCLMFPRGPKKPPFCHHCAMALSGVRSRRPVKPLPRGEVKKRRKRLKAQLTDDGQAQEETILPGTDLIEAPEMDDLPPEEAEESGGLLGRFRRRKDDVPDPAPAPPPVFEEMPDDAVVTVVGGPEIDEPEIVPSELHTTEHSSATALLEQLKDQDESEESVWLPSSGDESAATWTLPDMEQSPLGGSPWDAMASHSEPGDPATVPAGAMADAAPPMFVSEAELRSQGPADKDDSGNWVPPSLRGMAPTAKENADELPRRRRRTEEPQ